MNLPSLYSHHYHQHKMASLNFFVHRLTTFLVTSDRFEKKENLIKNVVISIAYSGDIIDEMM